MTTADTRKRPATFDLQLFAEAEVSEPTVEAATIEAFLDEYVSADGNEPGLEGDTQGDLPEETPEPTEDLAPDPAVEPEMDFIADKFKSAENPIVAQAKAYIAAEKKISEQGQEKNMTQKQIDALTQSVSALTEFMHKQVNPEKATPSKIDLQDYSLTDAKGRDLTEDQWRDFYDENPKEAIATLIKSNINPLMQQYIQPMAQELQMAREEKNWNRQVAQAQTKYGYEEVNALFPIMDSIFRESPDLVKTANGFDIAFNLAKARITKPQEPQVTVESINDDLLKQLASDPKARAKLVRALQESLKKPAAAPTVMGNQPGTGLPPTAPSETIRNTNEAAKLAQNFIGRMARK